MTELVPVESIQFVNGEPLCAFQECYRCFEGREILFRLVNVEKKQWFFFNNTTDIIVHVRAVFSAGSVIKPLQRATMRVVPDAAGVVDEASCATEVTLDVEPGYTESFIEGDVKGFHFEFRTETAPSKDVVFDYRRPSVPYDKIYKCFKNNGNGLLFRLVDDTLHRWSFYNDTKDFMMRVSVTFANRAEVRTLGKTAVVASTSPERDANSVDCVLFIEPGHTEAFIEGNPVTYTLDFAAEPIPAVAAPKPAEEPVQYLNGSPDVNIIPHQSHVIRCFKEHGNGLLFRIVDDYNNIWAFYNDTTGYVMTANMRYPLSSTVQVAPGVQLMADTEREGGVVAAVEVPPLATVPFLVGTPATYELAFSANPVQMLSPSPSPATSAAQSALDAYGADSTAVATAAHAVDLADPDPAAAAAAAASAAPPMPPTTPPQAPVREEAPHYEHGQPDVTVMPRIDEVYRCFKDHGNGLLFRLVDTAQRRWAFYNDTTDIAASVRVEFHPAALIQRLGRTEMAADAETGNVYYALRVEPLETALFVEGDVDVFATKFMAERIRT